MFILEGLKVLCFDTLLQVLILKGDSGIPGALAQFFVPSILLQAIFPANVGGKGVRRLVGYFMGYYTIWLALVKRFFVPFWEFRGKHASALSGVRKVFTLEPWKAANRLSRFLFCNSYIVQGLQVQPEPRAGPKEMAQ
ncbi:MAG TPA: hypothetical protein VN943_19380, partial [Candidatus Acidoferrum sp.]|nr:hypothetical protein [Candidatus Acidoferrum sp.]